MIITQQKPFEEIIGFLERSNAVFICGCSECATLCKTGGEEEVKQMKKRLEETGKKGSGWVVLDPACNILENKKHFRENKAQLSKADSILVLACGNGVQAVSESIDKIVYPGVNTLFLGDIIRFGQFEERCQLCGECLLDKTGGICPISRCSKSLLNGPCGGSENGKCEIDPDIDCAWQLIIDRLSKQEQIDRLKEIIPAKDWSTSRDGGPRKLNIREPHHKKMATSEEKKTEEAKTPVSSVKANSNLRRILDGGEFAVTGELGPPKGADAEVIKKKALYFKDSVDAVNITDNQTAIVRMSSIAAGVILSQMDIEPVIQMVCRDRNRLAIQSDILGAAALGIRNVLCLSGDHQKFGNHPQAKNVYDLDAIGLIQVLKSMRDEKKFLSGDSLTVSPQLYIGAVENPYADPYEFRAIRLAKKIEAGCDFIQTQGVFNVKKFRDWMKIVRDSGLDGKVHILAGVIPIKSAGMARYMRDYVSGVSLPDEIVSRMEDAKDPKEEGTRICVEIIEQLKEIEGIHGIHIMAVAWENIIPVMVKQAKLWPRPKIENIRAS